MRMGINVSLEWGMGIGMEPRMQYGNQNMRLAGNQHGNESNIASFKVHSDCCSRLKTPR